MTGRSGLSLLELVVAMVVGAVLLTAALAAQAGLDRVTRGRAERAGAGATLRAGAAALEWELSSLGTDSLSGPDVAAIGTMAVSFRAHRGLFIACRLGPDSVTFSSGRLGVWRARGLVAGRDSVLLYSPGDSTGPLDGWLAVPLLAGPFARACPGGESGELFTTGIDSTAWAALRLPAATIARSFEVVEIAGYGGGASWQLGQEGLSAGATIQPVAGPLDGAGGLVLSPWDRSGSPTSLPAAVAGVDVIIRALARREVAAGPGRVPSGRDSLTLSIRLGNVP